MSSQIDKELRRSSTNVPTPSSNTTPFILIYAANASYSSITAYAYSPGAPHTHTSAFEIG